MCASDCSCAKIAEPGGQGKSTEYVRWSSNLLLFFIKINEAYSPGVIEP
jgi:hypothetical protein